MVAMKIRSLVLALFAGWLVLSLPARATNEIVVYSARNEQLIRPLFEAYTRATGVKVRFITDKEGPLLARLKAEGPATPADIFLTVDAGNLWLAAQEGVLAKVDSPVLQKNIPAHLRDPGKTWYGLSVRARTIVYHAQRVKPADLSTYEALGDPRWKGRLCLRTSKKVYNQSLVAMMIARHGEAATEELVRRWVANLATDVFSSDDQVMEAILAGQCDVGIVNTYYYGRLMKKQPGAALALYWPNQKSGGVHVNISGAGVTTHARHREAAVRFLEWLSSPRAQNLFADVNLEFPANPAVSPTASVAAWGKFRHDETNLAESGRQQVRAVKLMDRAGYK
jgi:iron(III) transport system substrate-binding protein